MAQNNASFNAMEIKQCLKLIDELVGHVHEDNYIRRALRGIALRIKATESKNLNAYLNLVAKNPDEKKQLTSTITIHATRWFDNPKQIKFIEETILKKITPTTTKNFNVHIAGCSSGEELFSFALTLENIRIENPGFDYKILATDIDPLILKIAKKSIYRKSQGLSLIPKKLHKFLLLGSRETKDLFTFETSIRNRIEFQVQDITLSNTKNQKLYDLTVCRNVLMSLNPSKRKRAARTLFREAKQNSILCVSQLDQIQQIRLPLKKTSECCYMVEEQTESIKSLKALVIDDSATWRAKFTKYLTDADFEVSNSQSADEATEFLKHNRVDIITLDLHMPGIDGKTWLIKQRQNGLTCPVVIISAASSSEALKVLDTLQNGAQDYFDKENVKKKPAEAVGRLKKLVSESVKKSMGLRPSLIKQKGFIIDQPIKAILIGASTGGTQALVKLLPNMPIDCPPIVVVQHILGHFAEPFYKRLCEVSGLKMVEPRNNLLLEPGYLYMATGDFHIGIAKLRGELVLITSNAQPFGSHRPAVNFLFRSAQQNPKNICAILLTGMGSDGASGLSTLHKLGVPTFVQNEESCEIFGMPKEAIKLGAASFVGDLDDIRAQILHGIRKKKAA